MNVPHGINLNKLNVCVGALLRLLDIASFVVNYDDFLLEASDMEDLKNKNPFNRFI